MSLSVFPVSLPVRSLPGSSSARAAGVNGNAFAGLFAMLQQQGLSALPQQELSLQDGSKARLLLVPSDNAVPLQETLSHLGEGQNGVVSILAALTAGTPLLPDGSTAADTTTMQTISLDQLADLVSNHSDALSSANVLLIVAPASPVTLDELVNNISAALNLQGIAADQATPDEQAAGNPLSDLNVFLVTLAPPQNEQSSSETDQILAMRQNLTDDPDATEVDFLLYSGLIVSPHIPANNANSGNDISSGQTAFSTDAATGENDGFDGTQPLAPFEVSQKSVANSSTSLPDTSPDHGGSSPANNISGKLDLAKAEDASAAARFMSESNGLGLNSRFVAALAEAQQVSSPLTNPSLNNSSAAVAHPAAQSLAARLTQAFQNGEIKSQQLSIQLDPPELGKVQVHLSLEKGDTMKIHLVADNEDTLNLLKRDIHNLRHTLDVAGIKTDDASLSFDMSNDGNAFQQAMQQQNGQSRSTSFGVGIENAAGSGMASGTDHAAIDTTLGIHVDTETGTVRYNIMA